MFFIPTEAFRVQQAQWPQGVMLVSVSCLWMNGWWGNLTVVNISGVFIYFFFLLAFWEELEMQLILLCCWRVSSSKLSDGRATQLWSHAAILIRACFSPPSRWFCLMPGCHLSCLSRKLACEHFILTACQQFLGRFIKKTATTEF